MRAIRTHGIHGAGIRPANRQPSGTRLAGTQPSGLLAAALAAVLAAGALAVPALAQDVTYQETSSFKLEGGLGALANFAAKLGGGSMKDIVTTTYLSGDRMRVDGKDESTIWDADAGTVTTLNHKDKTYFQETFQQMAQAAEAARAQMDQARAQQQAEKTGKNGQDSVKLDVSFHVSVDRSGEHQKVAGFDAERDFVTLEAVGTGTRQSTQEKQQVGSMVFFNDVWTAQNTPLEKARRNFQEAMLKKNGSAMQAEARGLAGIFTRNPEMSEGMKQSAQELEKIKGTPVRTTSYVVLVSPDQKFDRNLALGEEQQQAAKPEKKKSGGFFGRLAKAAEKAAESQNTSDKSSDAKSAPPQATAAIITSEVTSIKVGAIPASTFAIPAGYKGIPAPTMLH